MQAILNRGARGGLVGLAALWAAALASDLRANGADVYLAPEGQDIALGSVAAPVATLRRALDLARAIRAAEPDRRRPIVIEAAGGTYELEEPVVLTPEDSGTVQAPTVVRAAADAKPVFSGGRRLTGWKVKGSGDAIRWTLELEEVARGAWNFAQLFVNDQRRFRPRLPSGGGGSGWFTIAGRADPSEQNARRGHDRFVYAPGDLRPDWANLGDVEVVAVHRWTMSRMRIGSLDEATHTVTFTGPTRALTEWSSFPEGNVYLVENVREALGDPGSWYLDRPAGELSYCPLPGEEPDNARVVAPRLERLLEIRGDVAGRRFVEHVRFEGLTFAHGNWSLPPAGQSFPQAEVNVGGAVTLTGARQVTFSQVAIRQVGRYALEFGAGCRDCRVEQSELVDLGGGGVLIGTSGGPQSWGTPGRLDDPEAAVSGIAVRDTTIAHGGRLHSAAVGVWIGHAAHCAIEHCDIFDFTYTGVSVGWVWGYAESPSHHNRIAFNHIHSLGFGVLSDLGGVYTLGRSPGTVVEGNLIHDVTSRKYGGWGLYTDEGSTGIVMRGNLVMRTSSAGFHQHYGRDNLIENNIFAEGRDGQLQRTRVEDHQSFRFERNIVWWNSAAPLVRGDWMNGLATSDNCYFNAVGPVVFPGPEDLAARQSMGQDLGSIVADPRFRDPARDDFTLAGDSPALALGFVPIDPSEAGRRTPQSLSAALPPVPTIWPEALPPK